MTTGKFFLQNFKLKKKHRAYYNLRYTFYYIQGSSQIHTKKVIMVWLCTHNLALIYKLYSLAIFISLILDDSND